MKILIGHNFYQQAGGEDLVFRSHSKMLEDFGHDVYRWERRNDEIPSGIFPRFSQALSLKFSRSSYNETRRLISAFKPDVAHFHNTFFMMTPSVFQACRDEGVPVAVSLHNFRLMCINGLFFRDNRPCEDCLTGSRLNGIRHKCYRGSLVSSVLLTDMISHHWRRKTWTEGVDRILTATEFSRQKHIQAGISPDRIAVLPHFVADSGYDARTPRGNYALYAGRLSEEKGLDVLLKAWRNVKDIPLYILGTGPQKQMVQDYILREKLDNVRVPGFLSKEEYLKVMREAMFLVAPCLSYDNFPMVIVEAYSYGVPVLASRLGSLEEAVQEGETGLLFAPGDAADLAEKARALIADESEYRRLCAGARQAYESNHTPQKHYDRLMTCYHSLKKKGHIV